MSFSILLGATKRLEGSGVDHELQPTPPPSSHGHESSPPIWTDNTTPFSYSTMYTSLAILQPVIL
jgi:hypothetical protein